MTMPYFTVFIPTYNRGYCIEEALASCAASSFKDFELIVIDDGSVDDTAERVRSFMDSSELDIRYAYQENLGKHVAFNHAVQLAKGKFFLTLDSDDSLIQDGLQALYDFCLAIEPLLQFASVEFRCEESGVASSAYPEPYLDSSYVERRLVCSSRGEKRSAYRLAVLKDFPYPVFEGERYCRPGLIDIRMAKKYKTRFCNVVVINAGHFPDGIGANRRKIIAKAPQAYRQYFLEEIVNHAQYSSKRDLRSYYKRFCRCSLNAGVSISQQYKEVPKKMLLIAVLPECLLASIGDRLRWRKS